jgi:hypothetical protein
MRRTLFAAAVLSIALVTGFTSCGPTQTPVATADLQAWQTKLEVVVPASSPPPIVRQLVNVGIRAGVPVACPVITSQAADAYKPFVTGTCDAIVASNDPFTATTGVLPALCAGNPPLGATVFPNLKPALIATCPLLLQLIPLLNLTQYVPGFGTPAPTG